MAFEESSSSAAAIASSSSSSVDSYIGSVISLTSKSEIRYEGILASINPHESTIALHNVRSYGTEGRKNDGPQIPPSDKVYEYILFRGSDIKDLQVKSSSSVPTKPHPHSDPAIIQSHYAYAPAAHTASASGGGGSLRGQAVHPSLHPDLARQSIPDSISLNQTGANPGSWVSSSTPTYTNGSSLTTPMYSQGYFSSLSGQAHALQQSVPFQSQPVIMQNQLQYPEGYGPTGMPNLPRLASPLTFSSTVSPTQFSISNLGYPPMLSSSNGSSIPSSSPSLSSYSRAGPLTLSNQDLNTEDMILRKVGPSPASCFSVPSLPLSSSVLGPASGPITTFPPLLTPDQLVMSTSTTHAPLQKLHPEPKEMALPSSATSLSSACALPQAPLLPLPTPPQQGGHGATQFTEEFDFTTMNEKFNKDEVWGSLGKGKPSVTTRDGTEDDPVHDNIEVQEGFAQDPKLGSRPVYNKDDFFDTLSCNSLNRGGWSGRTKFSERMKLDTETFGEFQQRPPLGRGNPGAPHYGNLRGSYSRGRGYGHYGGRGHGGYRPM